jgi:hypothetical protein
MAGILSASSGSFAGVESRLAGHEELLAAKVAKKIRKVRKERLEPLTAEVAEERQRRTRSIVFRCAFF